MMMMYNNDDDSDVDDCGDVGSSYYTFITLH
jgi:hypothetical protein